MENNIDNSVAKLTVYRKLAHVQATVNAPKGRWNSFGGYKFRSAEDIISAVKPILNEIHAAIILSDGITQIGDRYYVESVAEFIDIDSAKTISVKAMAREDESRKGMGGDQLTGCASSFARKYALNGLLLIDDGNDSDSQHEQKSNEQPNKKPQQQSKAEVSASANVERNKAAARLKTAVKAYAALDQVADSADTIMAEIKAEVEKDKTKNTAEFYNAKAAEFEEAVKSC